MGVAFYHPTESERMFMKELQECLQKESWFKRVNQDSMVPPLQIQSFHEKSSYYEWVVGLLVALVIVVLVGCIVEFYQHYTTQKHKSSTNEKKLLTGSIRSKSDSMSLYNEDKIHIAMEHNTRIMDL